MWPGPELDSGSAAGRAGQPYQDQTSRLPASCLCLRLLGAFLGKDESCQIQHLAFWGTAWAKGRERKPHISGPTSGQVAEPQFPQLQNADVMFQCNDLEPGQHPECGPCSQNCLD